jgi:hypothetical protein
LTVVSAVVVKPVPVTVTDTPPCQLPKAGLIAVTVGATANAGLATATNAAPATTIASVARPTCRTIPSRRMFVHPPQKVTLGDVKVPAPPSAALS